MNNNGQITYCVAPLHLRGKYNCNHIAHKKDNETEEEFIRRIEIKKEFTTNLNNKYHKINDRSILILFENEDFKDFAKEQFNTLLTYVEYIMNYNIRMTNLNIQKDNYDASWYRESVQSLDRIRRESHNAAISSLSILNRMCQKLNIDNVFPVDPNEEDRTVVANSIFEYFKDFIKN